MGSVRGPVNAYAQTGFQRAHGAFSGTVLNEPFVRGSRITFPIIERNGYELMPLTVCGPCTAARRCVRGPACGEPFVRRPLRAAGPRSGNMTYAQMRMICNRLTVRHTAIAAAALFIFVMVLERRRSRHLQQLPKHSALRQRQALCAIALITRIRLWR